MQTVAGDHSVGILNKRDAIVSNKKVSSRLFSYDWPRSLVETYLKTLAESGKINASVLLLRVNFTL